MSFLANLFSAPASAEAFTPDEGVGRGFKGLNRSVAAVSFDLECVLDAMRDQFETAGYEATSGVKLDADSPWRCTLNLRLRDAYDHLPSGAEKWTTMATTVELDLRAMMDDPEHFYIMTLVALRDQMERDLQLQSRGCLIIAPERWCE